MKTTGKALGTGLLTGMLALLPATSTQAATATTTVEINFPQILILYTFDQIDLAVDAAGLADAITTGTTACSGDYCSDQGTSDLSGTLLNLDGAEGFLRRVRSDRFGLYRIDGLAPGTYLATVRAVDGAAPATSATRELTVADDFLFNQDLVLAQPSPAQ